MVDKGMLLAYSTYIATHKQFNMHYTYQQHCIAAKAQGFQALTPMQFLECTWSALRP